MISFEYPAALALLLVPPGLALIRRLGRRYRARSIRLPLDIWGGASSLDAPGPWRLAYVSSSILFTLAWCALSFAAAAPTHRSTTDDTHNAGVHVIFAIDASPSMAARDLEPTRLEAAKEFVSAFLTSPEGARGASIGLVAFGAEAALACPPTTDYLSVLQRLKAIEPGILGDGTALGQGLASALRQIRVSGTGKAIAVLLSDGEDNVGLVHPDDAARALGSHGASVFVIRIGSRGDVPIDYVNPKTGQRMSGAYRSSFDDLSMSGIAEAGGGVYRTVNDVASLESLVLELNTMTRDVVGSARDGKVGSNAAFQGSLSTTHPAVYALFYAAMAMAAGGWAIRRLVLGGLA